MRLRFYELTTKDTAIEVSFNGGKTYKKYTNLDDVRKNGIKFTMDDVNNDLLNLKIRSKVMKSTDVAVVAQPEADEVLDVAVFNIPSGRPSNPKEGDIWVENF